MLMQCEKSESSGISNENESSAAPSETNSKIDRRGGKT
jgi:hypothetical protein